MSNQNSVELENIKTVNSIAMGFNEKSFLLVFNGDKNGDNGDAYAIPIKYAEKIAQGLIDCGLEYQKIYGKNIGFQIDAGIQHNKCGSGLL